MQKSVFESMYTKLLIGALQAIDLLTPAESERDLRALCCLKRAIKQAEGAFHERYDGKEEGEPGQNKKAAPAGRP